MGALWPRLGSGPLVMGVINLTPDSFWAGSRVATPAAAAELARRLVGEGADVLDVGAVSTRPGAPDVPVDQELERLLPALEAIRRAVDLPLSVDTSRAVVARAALDLGAEMVNDVGGLADPELARLPVPRIAMDRSVLPADADVIEAVEANLRAILARAAAPERLIVDPGFGFGKTVEQNLDLVRRLGELRRLGRPLCLGPSRKGTIARLLGGLPVDERLEGTAALVALAVGQGADLLRVHDVRAMSRVCRVAAAVGSPGAAAVAPAGDWLRLRGLRLVGVHGVFEREHREPQPFEVDVELRCDLGAAGRSDRLAESVDYGRVAQVVEGVLTGPHHQLIEALAEEIAGRVLAEFGRVREVRVRVHKPEAPIGLPFGDVHAEVRRCR